jgi:hypothetical protein
MNSFIIAAINALRNMAKEAPDEGREDETEKDWETISKRFLADFFLGPFGMVFGVREAAQTIGLSLAGSKPNWEVNSPVFSTWSDFLNGIASVTTAIAQAVTDDGYSKSDEKDSEIKWNKDMSGGIKKIATSVAASRGVPLENLMRLGESAGIEFFPGKERDYK